MRISISLGVALLSIAWLIQGHGFRGTVTRWITAEPGPRLYSVRVRGCEPRDGAFGVRVDAVVTARFDLPRGGIDAISVNESSILLIRTADQKAVPAAVEMTGPNTIRLRPDRPLQRAANYTVYITAAVRHRSGAPTVPWASSFTTENDVDPSIRFERVNLPAATGAGFTCLQVSADDKLWASSDDGRFFIFDIAADGTLASPRIIKSLQVHNDRPRLVTGFCFDPASSAQSPVIWACNNEYTFNNAPDFSGKLTRLAGPDLEDVEDVIVNLPRSVRDHMTNQPSIGPDGAIYFPQGSSSSFGAPDELWGDRPEHLLTATILRVDRARLMRGLSVDVLTADAGGGYDPSAPDAPLSIYATGVRNAYDLCWHSNGRLYVPTNGSSAGGHAPAGGGAPPLRDISVAEDDWLFDVAPDKYHGHPNPVQNRYVLNGGNPTGGYDFAETFQYPVGTRPDPRYQPPAYSFGKHVSANGVIEYTGNAFARKLKRKLLVCRYNLGGDIIALGFDRDGRVNWERFGIAGLSQLINPLDIIEDRRRGNLYICEYGAMRITLFRPVEPPQYAMPQ